MARIEIKPTTKELSFSWESVFDVITDVSVHGIAQTMGSTPSASNISSFFKTVRKSVRIDEPVENQAYRLVLLCFAAAIDELRPVNTKTQVLEAARETVSKAKEIIDRERYFITSAFFSNPVSLPLYKAIRTIFIESLQPLWKGGSSIAGKLDSAFNTSLFKVLRLEQDLFSDLLKVLSLPTDKIEKLEYDWASYRSRLQHSFEVKPVFGQEESHVSLSQIFIAPRAYWTEKIEDDENVGNKIYRHHVLDLMGDMLKWAKDPNPSRCVRLLRGGPGSGKSSFAKALCAKLASDESVRPIFVELQRLRQGGSLKERTTNLLVDLDELFSVDPLSKEYLDSNKPIILVFDGLDELVVPSSKGAQQIAEDIWDDIDNLLSNLNTPEMIRVKALVTGRDPIIQAARSSRGGRKLNPLDVQRIIGLEEIDEASFKIGADVDTSDQRPNWWKQYAVALGLEETPPPIFSNLSLKSLTCEPLLCYLIALSGKAEESRNKSIANINVVYDKLIDDVWRRVWGDIPTTHESAGDTQKEEIRRLGPVGFFNSKDDFEKILEFVAIAAWRGGESRTATLEEFEKAIKHSEVNDIWVSFQESFDVQDGEDSFGTLALTFFFRQQDLANRGFEFTHKSFGEYLAARGIFRYLKDNHNHFKTLRSTSGLLDWVKLTGSAALTTEIVLFLKNEFSRQSLEYVASQRTALSKVLRLALDEGMPIRVGYDDTWRLSETRQANSEGAILIALSCVSQAMFENDAATEKIDLAPKAYDVRRLIERLNLRNSGSVYRSCFVGFNFGSEAYESPTEERFGRSYNDSLSVAEYIKFDFSHSSFVSCALSVSVLDNIKVINTDFTAATFAHGWINDVDFRKSKIDGALFLCSKIQGCRFGDMTILQGGFDEATIVNCNFSNAAFSKSTFRNAYILNCNFSNVNFADSNFENTKLIECDFSGADLSETKGLKISVLKKSKGNKETILPPKMTRPKHWVK